MEGQTPEPNKFSYPNADRTPNDTGEIAGPAIGQANQAARDIQNEQRHPTVHLNDALQTSVPNQTPNDMQTIRTFQSDVANAVHNDNVSLIKIALAEKKRQERQGTFDETLIGGTSSSKNKIFIGIGMAVVLIVVGGYFFWSAVISTSTKGTTATSSASLIAPLLEAEQNTTIDIYGKDPSYIEQAFQTVKAQPLSLGSMNRINFTSTDDTGVVKQLTAQDWLTALRVRAPDSLLRAFDPDFVLGTYSLSTQQDSFLILKVNSYDNAYAGMLAWEPDMEDDIGGFIINQQLKTIGQNGAVATSTNQFNGKAFVDRVLENKDTRVLLDDSGNIKMLYTFIDQGTLVIASNESVLKEVIFRLTTGRIAR